MAAKSQSQSNPAQDMLDKYAELSAKWFETTGAKRAQVRKAINQTALDLRQYHGLKGGTADQVADGSRGYVAFVEPQKTVTVTFDMDEATLLRQIEILREIVSDPEETDKLRSDADDRLAKFIDQAKMRGITVPEPEPTLAVAA